MYTGVLIFFVLPIAAVMLAFGITTGVLLSKSGFRWWIVAPLATVSAVYWGAFAGWLWLNYINS